MTRRRFPFTLAPGDYATFPKSDLHAIIRAADSLIATGGRAMLGKILKGSKDQKLLAHGLDKNPSYAYFADLTIKEIGHRVDWVIDRNYLDVEYDGDLPLLVHTATGWNICKGLRIEEFIATFDQQLQSQQRPYNMEYLKDRNRELITELIERVGASGEKKYIPILEDWAKIDYQKVKQLLKAAIDRLR
jgi:RQC domain